MGGSQKNRGRDVIAVAMIERLIGKRGVVSLNANDYWLLIAEVIGSVASRR